MCSIFGYCGTVLDEDAFQKGFEKTISREHLVLSEREKERFAKVGKEWLPADERNAIEIRNQEIEAEEIFKEELRVKCEKKNLNYEEEYAKHVETNEANKAKKLEKEAKAKEKADAKEAKAKAKAEAKWNSLSDEKKAKIEAKRKQKEEKLEALWKKEFEVGEADYAKYQAILNK